MNDRAEGQYFEATPAVRSAPRVLALTLPDLHLELQADRGVFSADRVDPGTRVLLLDAPPPAEGVRAALDLGCGYGPIALTLAHRAPTAAVWAVDVNERALECCRHNARAHGFADRIRVVAPTEVPDDLRFDLIWSNPPVRIGKAALQELLGFWLGRLDDGGTAMLVVQKHLGSDSLQRWLELQGFHTERLLSRKAYRLLEVRAR